MTRSLGGTLYIIGDSNPTNSEQNTIVNTLFLNTNNNTQWMCTNATAGAQVWEQKQSYITVGPWTPVLAGTSTAGTATYTTQVGSYSNTGTMIIGWFNLAWSGTTGTGNASITGLPVAASSSVGITFQPAWTVFSLPVATITLQASISSTTINFSNILLNATSTPLVIPAAGSLSGSFIYPI